MATTVYSDHLSRSFQFNSDYHYLNPTYKLYQYYMWQRTRRNQ